MKNQQSTSTQNAHRDPLFGEEGRVILQSPKNETGIAQAIATSQDGKIYVAGSFGRGYFLARLQENGIPDDSFGKNGFIQDLFAEGVSSATGISLLKNEETILLSGVHTPLSGSLTPAFALYDKTGNLVKGFGSQGKTIVSLPRGQAPAVNLAPYVKTANGSVPCSSINADGKILGVIHPYIFQLDENGQLDKNFKGQGYMPIRHPELLVVPTSIVKTAAAKILVSGIAFTNLPVGVGFFAQYHADGDLDTDFGEGGFTLMTEVGNSNTILALPYGRKILGVGMTRSQPHKAVLVRLNEDGKWDSSFNGGNPVLMPTDERREFGWYGGAVDADGRIIATGGSLEPPAPTGEGYIATARFSDIGEVDTSFGSRTGWVREEGVRTEVAAVDRKRRIIVAGLINLGEDVGRRPVVLRYLP